MNIQYVYSLLGILSLFSDHTAAKVRRLRGPFEVQSPSEPLNWGQGGQRQIWLPQQLETGPVWEVSGDRFPSREMMLKWRLRIRQSLQTLHSLSLLYRTLLFLPSYRTDCIFVSISSLSFNFPSHIPTLSLFTGNLKYKHSKTTNNNL